ncbi:MAG: hypothetical protein Q8Q31_01375 [Nanoarchaeota archaeon]|nr:hypothetical protein [Nanoarchaeota archaeon]
MIKSKRAQEFTAIMIVMLAIFALILIMVFWKQGAIDTMLPFFKNLPGFKNANDTVKEVIKFRYIIPDDKVQYYDGVTWYDFETSEYPRSKKRFYASHLNEDLERSYFDPFRKYNRDGSDKNIKVDGKSVLLVNDIVLGSKSFSSQTFTNYVVLNDGQFIFDKNGELFERDRTGGQEIVGQINPVNEPFKPVEILKVVIEKESDAYKQSPAGLRSLHLNKIDGVYFSSEMVIDGEIGKVIIKRDASRPSDITGILPEEYELKCFLDEGGLKEAEDYKSYRTRDVAETLIPTKLDVLCDLYNYGVAMDRNKIKVLLVVNKNNPTQIQWGKIFVAATYKARYNKIEEGELLKVHAEATGIPVEKVENGIWEWLDKNLRTPKKLRYTEIKKDRTEDQKEEILCVQRVGKDLFVDFNRPVSPNASCP